MCKIGTVNMEGKVIEVIETKTIDCIAFFFTEKVPQAMTSFMIKKSFGAASIPAAGKA